MKTATLIALALITLPAQAERLTPFQQHCRDSEAIVASVQAPQANAGLCAHRGQLSQEDEAQIASVQPGQGEPLRPLILTGLPAHRGQLGEDDIALMESVRSAGAILYGRSHR